MTFASDLVAQLERVTAGQPIPCVRALHLPPAEAAAAKNGEFCALELDDGALGISYVLLGGLLTRLAAADDPQTIVGMDALQLAREFVAPAADSGDRELRRTLGFAACNALSRTVMTRMGFAPPRATDSIGGSRPARRADHVGMVGLFSPLLKQVTAAGARLTVIELNPDYAGHYDGYRVTLDASALEGCNKVLSTSTILLNHTVDDMLAHCRRAGRIVLIGPSAGCLPDPLFARGVSVVGGSWITDRAGFVDALRRGESWSAFAYKFALAAADSARRARKRMTVGPHRSPMKNKKHEQQRDFSPCISPPGWSSFSSSLRCYGPVTPSSVAWRSNAWTRCGSTRCAGCSPSCCCCRSAGAHSARRRRARRSARAGRTSRCSG